ncbi:MAG: D-cysteine desulfhydrase [Cellvibrionaceae bacterium]
MIDAISPCVNVVFPESQMPRLALASLPTPMQALNRFSKKLGGPTIWVKRDDLSGSILSGNKVRKLEFTFAYAIDKGHDLFISCGGIQSNHCRATAFIGAQLGMPVHLLLRGNESGTPDGNLLLDYLAGASVHSYSPSHYHKHLPILLEQLAADCRLQGYKPYIIPTGASDGVGVWGYLNACKELAADFKHHSIQPELIVTATGSGGTQAGLTLGNHYFELGCTVLGMAVCDDANYFAAKVKADIVAFYQQFSDILPQPLSSIDSLSIKTNDHYIGDGYGIASDQVLDMIIELSREEGILLDPVYTGKAFYGLVSEIKAGNFADMKDIVFIHTGGCYGLFPYKEQLAKRLVEAN